MTATPERLDAITARLEAATPGPWEVSTGMADRAMIIFPDNYSFKMNGHPDAEFIANAPTDVAYLLDLARKQAAAQEAVRDLAAYWNRTPALRRRSAASRLLVALEATP